MDFNLSDDQLALSKTFKEFTQRELEPEAKKIDASGTLPDDLIKKLASLKALGMVLPEEFGGAGASHLNCVLVCEQLAYSGTAAWWLVAFHNSIPASIYRFGTPEQRKKYLPLFCDGSGYASIDFTEEDTGSDPAALKTSARPEGDYYVINGMKRFSTFGRRNGLAVLYAKDETGKCTAFIINKNFTGYNAVKTWDLMGSGGAETADVRFENMKVPWKDMLGKKGEGFNVLLYWIALEKIEQSAAAVGIGQAATDEAITYAKSRIVKGKPISDMQGIRWMMAEMRTKVQAARLIAYRAAFLVDQQAKDWMAEASAAKVFVVPMMMEVVEMSRRIHGAYGYTKEMKIERLYRAIPGASVIAVGLEINKSIASGLLLG
jgi:alkylation response protein AidB-like acyl-CoA dehydrogenase